MEMDARVDVVIYYAWVVQIEKCHDLLSVVFSISRKKSYDTIYYNIMLMHEYEMNQHHLDLHLSLTLSVNLLNLKPLTCCCSC